MASRSWAFTMLFAGVFEVAGLGLMFGMTND
jgi:hypothetical protein